MSLPEKIVYLMRGLPSCGKSFTARKIAGDRGVVCETDEYFYSQVGDNPDRYDYQHELMDEARKWNFERYRNAVDNDISPIVVDRGNGLTEDTKIYAQYAVEHQYDVELKEPESEWWQEIRVLLKYKRFTRPILEHWARILARMSSATHRVPVRAILRGMERWKSDLTVKEILQFSPQSPPHAQNTIKSPDKDRVTDEHRMDFWDEKNLDVTGSWVNEFLFDIAGNDDREDANKGIFINMETKRKNTQ